MPASTIQKAEIASLSTSVSSIQQDVAALNTLLVEGGADLDDESVLELLKRIEGAEEVAQGVEDRLDTILENLEDLLESLVNEDSKDSVEVTLDDESPETEAGAGERAKQ